MRLYRGVSGALSDNGAVGLLISVSWARVPFVEVTTTGPFCDRNSEFESDRLSR